MFLSNLLWNLDGWIKGYGPIWGEIRRFNLLNESEAKEVIGSKLLDQIKYFGSRDDALPEWREVSRIKSTADLWRIWYTLPVIGKHELKNKFIASEIGPRYGLKGEVSATGGSTGEPTPYFHDEGMLRWKSAATLRAFTMMGWHQGDPLIMIWGSERDIRKQRSLKKQFTNMLRNISMIDGYEMSSNTVDTFLSLLAKKKNAHVWGFSSMLDFIAKNVGDRREKAYGLVKGAWCGGEMLYEDQSERFEKVFGTPILNYYGSRELGPMAYQSQTGMPLQILRPYLFLEILDEKGQTVGPGEVGRLVFSSTVTRGTPFIRYECGDLGTFTVEDCDDSGIRSISHLCGRSAGLLILPNGKTLNNLIWNHLFKEFLEVNQFQVILGRDGFVRVILVAPHMSQERENELTNTLGHILNGVGFCIEHVDAIHRSTEGKLLQVIKEK